MASEGRIDVHHHVLPKFYIDAQNAGITSTAYQGFRTGPPSTVCL